MFNPDQFEILRESAEDHAEHAYVNAEYQWALAEEEGNESAISKAKDWEQVQALANEDAAFWRQQSGLGVSSG